MYKSIALFAVCIGLLSGLQACKKGENDPFFSTKSRKARLTGEWQLESSEKTENFQGEVISSSKFENGTFTSIYNSDTSIFEFESTLTFEKDGSFKRYDKETSDEARVELNFVGFWNFMEKNESLEIKDKECLSMCYTESVRDGFQNETHVSTYTETYENIDKTVWYIDRLSNDELCLKVFETTTLEDGTVNSFFLTQTYKKL